MAASVAEPSTPALCEVTARPASSVDGSAMVTVEPAIGVQVVPFTDLGAVTSTRLG